MLSSDCVADIDLKQLYETDIIISQLHRWGKGDLEKKNTLEKEMATHSSILAWKIPWTEESGGLKSMGLHDWSCVHEGGGRWVGSKKLVELKINKFLKNFKKKEKYICSKACELSGVEDGQPYSIFNHYIFSFSILS